jgi:hypothetical protein
MTDVVQGTEEWLAARRGIVTASVIGQLITPRTVQPAGNDASRALTRTLVAERITGWTEHVYVSGDMMRGTMDEPIARDLYGRTVAPVTECGFMIRDGRGWRLGYSPDGLVGDDGLIEVKSRRPKEHLATILADAVPLENLAQLQAGLFVSGRAWCDYISYCGGMPMWVKRVFPDERWFDAIVVALAAFEHTAAGMLATYHERVLGLPTTERIDYLQEVSF